MISALMYAMVFMACFEGTTRLKTLMEPSGPVSVEEQGKRGPEGHPGSKDRGGMGRNRPGRHWLRFPGTGTQDEVIRQEGYKEVEEEISRYVDSSGSP